MQPLATKQLAELAFHAVTAPEEPVPGHFQHGEAPSISSIIFDNPGHQHGQ
jgi:hypothetical protein